MKLLQRFHDYCMTMRRRRWIVTASLPFTTACAMVSWPSYLSAIALFFSGANAMSAFYLWFPLRIPFAVSEPTPEQVEEMNQLLRARIRPMLDTIAREAGFNVARDGDEQPTTRH